MAKSRIDEALDTVRELTPFFRIDQLPVEERLPLMMKLPSLDWNKILAELEYLEANLPTGDSRRAGVTALMPAVRNWAARYGRTGP